MASPGPSDQISGATMRPSPPPSPPHETSLRSRPSSTPLPGLAAEAASAALRDFARGRPSSKRSSTASSKSNSSFHSTYNRPAIASASIDQRPPSRHHASSPAISARSNTSSYSGDSVSASSDSADKNNPFESDQSPRPPPGHGVPPNFPGPPAIPRSRAPGRGRPGLRQEHSLGSSPHIPVTMSDLDREYSRYPLQSRRNSPFAPSTPVPQYTRGDSSSAPQSSHGSPDEVTQVSYVIDPEKKGALALSDHLGSTFFNGDVSNMQAKYYDEKEDDDDVHNPQAGDDRPPRPLWRELTSPRQLSSLCGLMILILGLLCVFILLPVLSYTGHAIYSYPYDPKVGKGNSYPTESWSHVNDLKYPLLSNIRTGLIDPKTPAAARTKKSVDGTDLNLVFSDEFSTPNRTFYSGDDPFWTAPDIWYGATQDMEWYDPDAVTTNNGTLALRLDSFINHYLLYRSGMLNSWNQMCFKGGSIEISASLPGPGGASGLWPGIWTMGNLGRPGYKASTEGLWPYTYNSCDAGITANQSMDDGTSYLVGQKLPSCTCSGEDHPTPGTGRGAPEIDIFEASADPQLKLGLVTQSYQVAPYDIWYHPNYDFLEIPNINVTQMNGYCGGPFQQAISAQTELNNQWYDATQYQTYGFEYTPGTSSDGKITWFVGPEVSFAMTGDAVGPNGNVGPRPISEEPMSVVLNVGFSTAWTGINMAELRFPTTMYVDYVRIYQPDGKFSVTCDPPGYETTDYIKSHPDAYHNPNLTFWSDTGYEWPKNKLNSDC